MCSSCSTPSASIVKVRGIACTPNRLDIGPPDPPSRYYGQAIPFRATKSFHFCSSLSRLTLSKTSGGP